MWELQFWNKKGGCPCSLRNSEALKMPHFNIIQCLSCTSQCKPLHPPHPPPPAGTYQGIWQALTSKVAKCPAPQGQLFPIIEANDPAHIPRSCWLKAQADVNGLNQGAYLNFIFQVTDVTASPLAKLDKHLHKICTNAALSRTIQDCNLSVYRLSMYKFFFFLNMHKKILRINYE